MKVALFQPYYLGWGGTEKVAYDLARYLPEQGIGLKIVTPGKGGFYRAFGAGRSSIRSA